MTVFWDSEKPPIWLRFRSSKWLIGFTAFVAAFTDGFLYSTVVPVLPFSLVDRSGVSEEHVQFWCSILLMTFGVTMTLGAPIAGWLADRSSSRQGPLLIGLALAFVATVVFCLGRAPWVLVIARVFQGFSASIIYTAGLALIADTVPADEVGSWMGFVLSGMNLGALIAPFLAGAIYDSAGYYAVFAVCLGVVAFDFILRVMMIEKGKAEKWLKPQGLDNEDWITRRAWEETQSLLPEGPTSNFSSILVSSERTQRDQPMPETGDSSSLSQQPIKTRPSWFAKTFPAMTVLLSSSRILAAVYGCFTHTLLISSFDAVLALFVKRTFSWTSTGAGLIFLAITIPSTLGTIIGALSDRYGPRVVSLFGFGLTVPALALMGVVTDNSVGHQAALIILLVAVGIGLNFLLAPLAADMFDEVESLTLQHPDTFGKRGAYAQAYSLFDAALGLATVVGPGWSGLFFEKTNWQITAGTLAVICALGGVPVYCYTGRDVKRDGKERSKASTIEV